MALSSNIPAPNWGPTGEAVYDRTYSRVKANGERETWRETCERVAEGNLALVYGPPETWPGRVIDEYTALVDSIYAFEIIPAGRHLWASGVKGRQYLFNCHVAGWGEKFSEHFRFTFLRLMEGGGVGGNYSSRFLKPYGAPHRIFEVHIVCDPSHPDYEAMKAAGILSDTYTSDWDGAYIVEDSREGWADALTDLLDTYMTAEPVKHDCRVYDVTNVRAAGARLKTFGGTASGPAPFATMMLSVSATLNGVAADAKRVFSGTDHVHPTEAMAIDHAIAECVVSGGVRRSARMSIVEWDDPYVDEFLSCKDKDGDHWTTNISVGINDEFIRNVRAEHEQGVDHETFDRWLRANHVYVAALEGMLKNGEPGFWNMSLSQEGEINEVIATNPCGEIVLEPWENCNLGHVNLQAFVTDNGNVRHEAMEKAHRLMARFLIRATFGDVTDDKQADRLRLNRRIGVGHLGVQGHLALRGIRWSDAPRWSNFPKELRTMRHIVRKEADDYAFSLRIPTPIKVTTVAPTGSIAKLPGVSEGIHPIYARHFIRRVRYSIVDASQAAAVEKFRAMGHKVETDIYDQSGNTVVVEFVTVDNLLAEVERRGIDPQVVESAEQIPLVKMLEFQAMYQKNYADNAVSFTVNIPAKAHTVQSVSKALTPLLHSLKGTTLMVDESRAQAPYERLTEAEYDASTGPATVADGIDEECANGACPIR